MSPRETGMDLRKLLWERFDAKRTHGAGGSPDFMLDAYVSLTMQAGSSHREDLEEIARTSSQPFPIASLSNALNERRSLRGRVYFGELGRQIDKIVCNYPGMRWWMRQDGLVVDVVVPETAPLAEFDREAGKLTWERTVNGKVSKEAILEIATLLDTAGFGLSLNLQKAQWTPIATFNQKHARAAVKTFVAAASHPQFIRMVRRRLYVARDRYREAYLIRS